MTQEEDRPWYDAAAERAVLGGCLTGNLETITRVREIFGTDNPYYLPKHAFIWAAICSLANERVLPDPVTVSQRMPRFQQNWNLRDGPIELFDLLQDASLVFNLQHARIVANYYAARVVRETAIRVQQRANSGDPDAIAAVVEEARASFAALKTGGAKVEPWHDLLIGGGAFVLDIPVEIPPVWGSRNGDVLWSQGESLMVVGPPGVGKSTLAGQLVAGRLGLLSEVLTLPIVPGLGRLLYIAGDRPAQIARSLRRTLNKEGWDDAVRDKLIVWRGPPPHMFTSKPETLLRMALDAGADTVVIDSIKDVATGIGDDIAAGEYNRARQLLLATSGIELLELHHLTKHGPNGAAPKELGDIYGNQQLTAGAGSVMLLWGEAGSSPVEMTHLKQPQNVMGPWSISHDHTAGMSRVERMADVIKIVAQTPAGLDATDVARAFFNVADPTTKQIEKITSRLQRFVDQGRLIKGAGRTGADGIRITVYMAASEEEPPDDLDDDGSDRGRYR